MSMNEREFRYEVGQDILTGRFLPVPAYNTAVQVAEGSVTAAGNVASFSLPAGARALVLRAYVANEGSSGPAEVDLVAGSSTLIPYYLSSPGMLMDSGDLLSPIASIVNMSTSPITVALSCTSITSGNTVKAAMTYMLMPDNRPTL
ncbi:MAG: hypothetical protein C0167_02190 [Nitrososphaera sp.]|nr:MAG: hypothetical protein C0167_02190 [Nitrososphaera sp.]